MPFMRAPYPPARPGSAVRPRPPAAVPPAPHLRCSQDHGSHAGTCGGERGPAADGPHRYQEVPVKHLGNPFTRARPRHESEAARPGIRHRLAWLGLGRLRLRQSGARRPARGSCHDAFDRLVALYTEASTLRDCALVETRVGEDALSDGDELRANQHFGYSRHYDSRAEETEASIVRELDRLRHDRLDWQGLSESALTRARQRLYGAAELAGRPQFD